MLNLAAWRCLLKDLFRCSFSVVSGELLRVAVCNIGCSLLTGELLEQEDTEEDEANKHDDAANGLNDDQAGWLAASLDGEHNLVGAHEWRACSSVHFDVDRVFTLHA